MRRTTLRRTRLALGLLAASLTLSACEFDVYSLPLPGGPDTGDDDSAGRYDAPDR